MKAETIAIVNQKGGTGKTTTAVNISRCLVMESKKVLLIDLDAQANLSYSLGINNPTYPVGKLMEVGTFNPEAVVNREGIDVLPTDNFLSEYEFTFIKESYPFITLKKVLKEPKERYDFIIIDCPPTVSFLTANALVAANTILIPMQMDVLSIQGLNQILYTVKEIKEELNPSLKVLGIVRMLVDQRRQLTREALDHIHNNFDLNIFKHYVRANVRAAEAPSYGKSIIEYDPKCNAAKDYINVTKEFLERI